MLTATKNARGLLLNNAVRTARAVASRSAQRQFTSNPKPPLTLTDQMALRDFMHNGRIGPYLTDVFDKKSHRLPKTVLHHGGCFPEPLRDYITEQHAAGKEAIIECGPVLSFSKKKNVATGFMQKHLTQNKDGAVLLSITPEEDVKGLDISNISYAGEDEVVFGASSPKYIMFPPLQNHPKKLEGVIVGNLTETQESMQYQGAAYQPPYTS